MRISHLLKFAIATGLLCSIAVGQGTTNSTNFGQPDNASFHGSEIDTVQMNNGNLHIEIPLYSLSGRGPSAGFKYVYDSKGWYSYTSNFVLGTPVYIEPLGQKNNGPVSNAPQPAHNMQWNIAGPLSNPGIAEIPGLGSTMVSAGGGTYTITYTYKEPSGASHTFQAYNSGTPPAAVYAIDGSGFRLKISPLVLYAKDGTQIYATHNGSGGLTGWILQDTNGNQLTKGYSGSPATTITDTLGRSLNSDFVWDAGLGKYKMTYTDSDGATQTIAMVKSSVTVQTHLCALQTSGSDGPCTEYSGTWQLPTEIDLPNGTKYTITYNQGAYGTPASITLPSGATIAYTWGSTSPGCGASSFVAFSFDDSGPRVTSRTITGADLTSATWNYAYSCKAGTFPGLGKATVTDPNGNDVVHNFDTESAWGGYVSRPSYEYETDYYNLSAASGTLLKTVATDYLTIFTNGSDTLNKLPIHTTTTWNAQGNLQQRTETDYDSAVFNSITIYWGNPVETREYGFGSGAYGSLARKTHFNYAHLSGNTNYKSGFVGLNIANRVTEKQVYDGNNNLLADSKTDYDQNQVNAMPGVQNHVTVSSQSRGNPTQIQACSAITGGVCTTWLPTNSHFDDLGHVSDTTDPGNHTISFLYGDNWSSSGCGVATGTYAFLTEVDAPSTTNSLGNTVQHRAKNAYFPCTGLKQKSQDENDIEAANGRGTTFTHEKMLRPKTATAVDTGQATNTYNDASLPLSTTTTQNIDGSTSITTVSVQDRLGRIKQTQLTSDPQGIVYTDTTFDKMGRVATVSNPYRSGDIVYMTQYQYDALGRKTLEIPPDGSSTSNNVQTSYGAQTTGVLGLAVTVIDQAGHQHKNVTDALGRLVDVWEPDATSGSLVNETQYQYDALGNLVCVEQHGNVTGTGCPSNPSNDATVGLAYPSIYI